MLHNLFVPNLDQRDWSLSRFGIWSAGILWVSHPQAKLQAVQSNIGYQLAAGMALLFLLATISFPVVPQAAEPDPTMSLSVKLATILAPLVVVSPFVVVSIMLYIILQSDAPSKTLAAGLSSRIWQPLSDRSYSIYLIHFDVGVLLFKALPLIELLGGPHNKIPSMVLPVLLYSASYIAAHLLDQLVDVIALTVMGQAAARSAKLKL